jgi:hypothetical protein
VTSDYDHRSSKKSHLLSSLKLSKPLSDMKKLFLGDI